MRRAGAKEAVMAQAEKLSGRPPAAASHSERVRWGENCDMENLVTETVADQGLTVSAEDETRLVSALPRNHSEEVVLEKLTNDDVDAIDAEAPGTDVIVDLVHGIESLTKDEARARLLELEEDQEKTFFEIGGVLSAIQKHKWFEPFGSLDE